MAHFLCDLHSGKLLMATQTEAILATMAKNTTTYFGLRALPCALNTTAPTILAHYTKSGKLRDLVCDNCILTHATGTTYISIFIQNYLTNTYGNNVDNAAILSLSELSRDTHVLMQKINNNK